MPTCLKSSITYLGVLFFVFTVSFYTRSVQADEGIQRYYIRYDIKSSNNKITDTNLVMIPAKNEFRSEKPSSTILKGEISADDNGSNKSIKNRIQTHAFKTVLIQDGLKSVNSKDYDIVISYEGVVITPLKIIKQSYNETQNKYYYEAQIEFSPIAFPDEWEKRHMKSKIKKLFSNFFQLFQ